jgi:hypothetical protein
MTINAVAPTQARPLRVGALGPLLSSALASAKAVLSSSVACKGSCSETRAFCSAACSASG